MCPESTNHECPDCDGKGWRIHFWNTCGTCGGLGRIPAPSHTERGGGTCPNCAGDGTEGKRCLVCAPDWFYGAGELASAASSSVPPAERGGGKVQVLLDRDVAEALAYLNEPGPDDHDINCGIDPIVENPGCTCGADRQQDYLRNVGETAIKAALTAPAVTKNSGDDRTGETDENLEARIFGVPYSVDPDLPPGCVRFGEKVLLIDRKNERLLEVLMAPAVPVVSDPEQVSVNREDLDRFVGFYFDGEYEGNYQFNNAGHVARAGQSLRAALDGDSQ